MDDAGSGEQRRPMARQYSSVVAACRLPGDVDPAFTGSQVSPLTCIGWKGDSDLILFHIYASSFLPRPLIGWWRGTVVERRSLAGELSLSCARPAADG